MNIVQPINLVDGLNINPISLEFSQGLTTTKWLLAMQAKINEVILIRNEVINEANVYSDTKYNAVSTELNNLLTLLNNGNIIPDGSIGLEKLKADFSQQFTDLVINTVHNAAQFVSFELNDNGHFIAVIPSTWSDIDFSTDTSGNLILNY